jgi:hypothetical protein
MDVDEPRRNHLPRELNNLDTLPYLNGRRNFSNPPVPQEDVAHSIDPLTGIDDPSTP